LKDTRNSSIIEAQAEAAWTAAFCEWGSGQPPLFFTPVFRSAQGTRPGRGEGGNVVKVPVEGVEEEIETRVERLGFELVDVEWGGSRRRPVLRIRVDLPDSEPGKGVTVGDCARVSRELEGWLDEHPGLPERYVIEVSSPGVERPLKKRRDFLRFRGSDVRVVTTGDTVPGKLEGLLQEVDDIGDAGDDAAFLVTVRTAGGAEARIPSHEIVRANLVFHWGEDE